MSYLDSTSQRHCDQQEQLAKEHQAEAARQVNDYKRELETQFAIPIVFEKLGANRGAGGTARAVWNQRVKAGIIRLICDPAVNGSLRHVWPTS